MISSTSALILGEPSTANNISLINSAVGAFFGAFFAFLFGILAFFVKKKWEDWGKRKEVCEELGYLLSDHLDDLEINENQYINALVIQEKGEHIINIPHDLSVPQKYESHLGEVLIVRKFQSYKGKLVRFNKSIDSWSHLNNLYIELSLKEDTHKDTLQNLKTNLINSCKILIDESRNLTLDCLVLLQLVNIYNKKSKYPWSILLWKLKSRGRAIITEKGIKDIQAIAVKELKKGTKTIEEKKKLVEQRVTKKV